MTKGEEIIISAAKFQVLNMLKYKRTTPIFLCFDGQMPLYSVFLLMLCYSLLKQY